MKKIKNLYLKYKEIINYLIFGGLSTVVNFASYYVAARVIGIDEVVSSGMVLCSTICIYNKQTICI